MRDEDDPLVQYKQSLWVLIKPLNDQLRDAERKCMEIRTKRDKILSHIVAIDIEVGLAALEFPESSDAAL